MNALTTHRKCMVCGETTPDLSKDTCSCGRYMFMIGQVYTPKVVRPANITTFQKAN